MSPQAFIRLECRTFGISFRAAKVFKVGDQVERIGTLVPEYMRNGIVIRVIPNNHGIEWLTEYEIDFGGHLVATFFGSQLRLVKNDSRGKS